MQCWAVPSRPPDKARGVLWKSWPGLVSLARAQHERNIAGGLLEGTATGVFGDLVYHFSEGRTQVFVVGSLGVLRSDITQTYPTAGGTQTFTRDESSVAWGGGAGVKVFLKPQIFDPSSDSSSAKRPA